MGNERCRSRMFVDIWFYIFMFTERFKNLIKISLMQPAVSEGFVPHVLNRFTWAKDKEI